MKIDKVIFSSSASPEYAPFWNLQAEIFKTQMGIEPVCLLYGKQSDLAEPMSEKHGQVIEVEADPTLPWSVQLVWSKFHHPTTEPDKTWLIGDIDLIPLQRAHFTTKIAGFGDDMYLNLNAGGIAQPRRGRLDAFLTEGCQRQWRDNGVNGGADLPGHYHVAKGKTFEVLTQGRPFLDQVRHIVNSERYGLGPIGDPNIKKDNPYWYYWCAEENYSSELIQAAIRAGNLNFGPVYYNNNNGTERINRDEFKVDYHYDMERCKAQGFVDIHCARPYAKQETQLKRIVNLAWGI